MDRMVATSQEMGTMHEWIENAIGTAAAKPSVKVECLTQGWGSLQKEKAIGGGPLCLNGRTFATGLGTHAPSEIVVRASAPIKRFTALAGVDDNAVTRRVASEMVFTVEVGGKVAWSSGPLRVSSSPAQVDLDLKDAMEFTLKVNDSLNYAHANWANAVVTLEDGTAIDIGTQDRGFRPALPFSFRYGGRESWQLLGSWTRRYEKTTDGPGVTVHRICHTDPDTGLECGLELKEFPDFPAAEWVLRFKNTGRQDTPILEDIQAMDIAWTVPENVVLHHSLGSTCRIDDFLLKSDPLPAKSSIELKSEGGRSSNGNLPFFNLAAETEGFISAIGWTGQWAATFAHEGAELRVREGMEKTHLTLHPGEEIRSPSILFLRWQGKDSLRGNNLLRRFILKYHTYRPDGKTVPTPITAAHWGGMKSPHQFDRINAIKEQRLDYDYYWIDAGWYGPADSYSPDEFTGDWAIHVGNWNVNPAAHPQGLRPISDAVHAAGMKFLLWFEPERAIMGTPLTREHPEWFLGEKTEGGNVLFNLGLSEARRWLTDFIDARIKEFGVDCYRQDFNIDPLPFWQKNDAPDRVGMTEIRYIEGLYAFWDELLRRNPGLIIDNCSSGGRRIDLETTGRSIPLWRSDVQCWPDCDPTASQVHTYGLVHWVPCSTTGTQLRPGDTYNFRSAMCTGVQFAMFSYERTKIDPNYPYDWHRKMLADQRRVIPYFLGDFYPLTSCSTSPEEWLAYQMHREDLNEGCLLAFRRENSPFIAAVFRPRALDTSGTYEFTDADTGETESMDAKTLEAKGLRITLDTPRSCRLIFYRKK